MNWKLDLGANIQKEKTVHFRVWAPLQPELKVKIDKRKGTELFTMKKDHEGYFTTEVGGVQAGDLYTYVLQNGEERPDFASRSQPKGVFGSSCVVDPSAFKWTDQKWEGFPLSELIFYECHVGTFTNEGTFDGLIEKLPYLKKLGINCLEIMPIAQFPGKWNWGYDGVYIYAPQNSYGGPQAFKRLVNAAHRSGIAICLDVVYNHLGPEGNFLYQFGPYFSETYHTCWGRAFNLDDSFCDHVRHFLIQNALYWIMEYHVDLLRLDAIHGLFDFSSTPFLQELSEKVEKYSAKLNRKVFVTAESDANDARVIRPSHQGGFNLSALWNEDFHHSLHVTLTKERRGYYQDFQGLPDLAKSLKKGFVFDGQYSAYRKRSHGNSANNLDCSKFIGYLQTHDQVGNRPLGERLKELISFEANKMAAAFLLLSPYVPLLFMGQEYAEDSPFLFFVDYQDENLMRHIYKMRKKEFRTRKPSLKYPGEEAYQASKLTWNLQDGKNQAIFKLYRDLIAMRKSLSLFRHLKRSDFHVHFSQATECIAIEYSPTAKQWLGILSFFQKPKDPVSISLPFRKKKKPHLLLHTEEKKYGGHETLTYAPSSASLEYQNECTLIFN